jgi:predicted RecB family nuclease
MHPSITASMLYDLVACPKRVELDLFGDPADRDEASPFVQMLWRRGALHERELVAGGKMAALDLSTVLGDEKERQTLQAMLHREPLIYGGRISADDLVGVPDLLRRVGDRYMPVDIKSGAGLEGGDDEDNGKPKLHYAVQLALYVDVLERLGLSAGRVGVILDGAAEEVVYQLDEPRGTRNPRTLWDTYLTTLSTARAIAGKTITPKGAMAAACQLCHWQTVCSAELVAADDLTLIAALGRTLRDAMEDSVPTVAALAASDPKSFIEKKRTIFPGVGPERLRTFQARAKLLSEPNSQPYLTAPIALPSSEVDFFFDIEVDPLRDFTYLHGIVERRGGDNTSERFVAFFAEEETPEAERDAFAQAIAHLNSEPTATIWYYSKYERTTYRKLQERYPEVCSAKDIEELFDPTRAVDLLFDIVMKATEWPTHDRSIKTLAKFLGFRWRDANPSGAASIEWFDRWVRERDPATKARILDYNEDDCRATRVLLDGIRCLERLSA